MDINKAKELTNKELKLYKKEQIGITAIGIASLAAPTGLTVIFSNFGTVFIDNNNLKLLYILLTALTCSLVGSLYFTKNAKKMIENKEYIKILKYFKKELDSNKNRFQNLSEEKFGLAIESYKKILTKNKEK